MEQFAFFHRSTHESCESLSPAQYAKVCVQKLNKCISEMKCYIWAPPFWQQWFKASKMSWQSHSLCKWKWSAEVEDCGFCVELGWIIVVAVLMLCWMLATQQEQLGCLRKPWEEVTTWTFPLFLLFLTLQCSQNSSLRGSPWAWSPRQMLCLLALEIICLTAALSSLVQKWISFTHWPADSSLLSFIELSGSALYFCALYNCASNQQGKWQLPHVWSQHCGLPDPTRLSSSTCDVRARASASVSVRACGMKLAVGI